MLGLEDPWEVTKVDLRIGERKLYLDVECPKTAQLKCPECGEIAPFYDYREQRCWRHLDAMQFETQIRARIPRVKCEKDGVLSVQIPWARESSRFTLAFEAFAIQVLQRCATLEDARAILGLNWEQVASIRKRAVEAGLERRNLENIERIGIDEKNFGKGHDYICVLADLDAQRIIDVKPERKQESALELLKEIPSPESVKCIAMDMWPAFMKAAEQFLPAARIVHDKYHIAAHLNKAVDTVRKQEHNQLSKIGDTTLNSTKYIWLTKPENMSDENKKKFLQLKSASLKTANAWKFKDMFDGFWTQQDSTQANEFFRNWYNSSIHSSLQPIKKVATMLKKHYQGLEGYILHRITNATTEGFNSKIQQIKAAARGFRNFENYRHAILFHCGKLDMMPVTHSLHSQES